MAPELVVGIDFGTSECKAAVVVDGKPQPVAFDGRTSLASVVHVAPRGLLEVGKTNGHPARTIHSIKRLLGRRHTEPEVRGVLQGLGYRVVAGDQDNLVIKADDQQLAPVQVVAAILEHVRVTAERQLGARIGTAVLSAPVSRVAAYDEALVRAARMAGLDVRMIVPEPTAAAWGAGLRRVDGTRRLALCDFGGGTFDCALLSQTGGKLEVEATGGDAFLGGDDLDQALADAVAGRLYRDEQVDLRRDAVVWADLVRRCELVKRMLSTRDETVLRLPDAYTVGGVRKELALRVPRVTAERCWGTALDRAVEVLRATLSRAQWPPQLLDAALFVGGTCWVPAVQRALGLVVQRERLPVAAMELAGAAGLSIIGAAAASRVSSAA